MGIAKKQTTYREPGRIQQKCCEKCSRFYTEPDKSKPGRIHTKCSKYKFKVDGLFGTCDDWRE